ncbi:MULTISPECIES: hypothetical protein [Halolamina]|uniref:DUF8113 domain-containing protein n=1 Tax=Halolamina pelagica TaxID=699431 RepID=A0A1I5TID6_9EURY|nr:MULTISPECIES: hypothetical protein [Halolamina]NHX37360.1 hypothetical protein [Halolamina sp. R1-12]SFP82631.1 hypothetical protein SAMN05216277_10994 [Halolamina pelagica]
MVDDTREDGDDEHATDADHDAGSRGDEEFARRVEEARDLIGEDATALYVGVVREGREVDSTFAQQADDHQQEGMQALSLLASHIRLVSDEAGVDYTTVAADAVTLAEQLDESE